MQKLLAALLCGSLLIGGIPAASAEELALPASCYGGSTFIGYTVKAGDTLYQIGRTYGFEPATLAAINAIADPALIEVGQTLKIPADEVVGHQITAQDTLDSLAALYGVDKLEIAMANDLWDMQWLPVGADLTIPGISQAQAACAQLASRSAASFALAYPVQGVISSHYGNRSGEFHTGTDIACAYGSEVAAAQSGQVTFAGWDGNYGYAVVIDHKNGYKTRYAHNSRLLVAAGDYVTLGEPIALAGSTGRSTGPHVHLEVLKTAGGTENPMNFLR